MNRDAWRRRGSIPGTGNVGGVCELRQLLRKTLKFEIKLSKKDKSAFKREAREQQAAVCSHRTPESW